jgi:hypothetical protein
MKKKTKDPKDMVMDLKKNKGHNIANVWQYRKV